MFKREQAYNLRINTLFHQLKFKKQSILPGHYVRRYSFSNRVIFDIFLYDTAYERIRRNIKNLRKLTAFNERIGGQYYHERNMSLFQQTTPLSPHTLFLKIYRMETVQQIQTKNNKYQTLVTPTRMPLILNTRYQSFLKNTTKARLNQYHSLQHKKLRKRILYFLLRSDFLVSAFRLKQRLCKINKLSTNHSNVNLISIPKAYVTMKIIMAFIIKRLYLNYTIHESITHFKKYLKLSTRGYILRACGKLTKKQRAWYVKRRRSQTKINDLSEYVTYQLTPAILKYGNVGVKLWINY